MYEFKEQTRALIDRVRMIINDHQTPLEARKLRGEQLISADYGPGREAAREAGLWGLRLPSEIGGADLSLVDWLAITEENYKCLTPIEFGGKVLIPDLLHLQGEQKARYLDPFLTEAKPTCFALTEPSGGSDPARNVSTYAERDGGSWVINGSKIWISGFDDADWVFVYARTAKEKNANTLSLFAVEKDNPGLIARPQQMLGGFMTHQLTFDDCRVDDLARIGAEGGGFKGAQNALNPQRLEIAARALGIAQRSYDMMVEYAKQRVVFGGALSDKQSIQSMIVDSWIEIQQNRLMMYTCAEKHDRGADTRIQASMIKMTCSEMVGRVIDRAIQIHGSAGCTYESPLAHWYDYMRMVRIQDGPVEALKYRVLARHLVV